MMLSQPVKYGMLTVLLIIIPSLAFSQFSLDGEFRPRMEYRDGYRILRTDNTEPAFFTSQRTRISLHYKADRYKMKISGQDVRVWGDVAQLQDNPNVNIHEAWAEVKVSPVLGVKLGRQELVYDNQRLLGSVNWTQQARSHDAILLKYRNSDARVKVDIGGAYNQDSERLLGNTYSINNYKVLSYLWVQKQWDDFDVSVLGLTDGFEQGTEAPRYRYTYGTNLKYNFEELTLRGEFYLQSGDDALRQDISAGMYALSASYDVSPIQLTVGYDHLSGGGVRDDFPLRHTFSTLYATNHKFYGHMDYFLNALTDTRGGGLQDFYLKTNYRVNESTNVALDYHYFALSADLGSPTVPGQILNQNLGSEIDLSLSHRFTQDIALKAGYSVLMPSESLEAIQFRSQVKDLQHWGWVMLSITPDFLD